MRTGLTVMTYLLGAAAVLLSGGIASGQDPASFEVRLVSASLKLFHDAAPPGIPGAPFNVTAVRNEYAPFQVAVSALKGESTFSVTITKSQRARRAPSTFRRPLPCLSRTYW